MDLSHFRIWMLEPGSWWWTHVPTGAWHGTAHGPFRTFPQAAQSAADTHELKD